MTEAYRIYGAEMSPYSVKVRSYFRYKQIPHRWIVRNSESQAEYQKYAKIPLIPLVVSGENQAMQDSTPILESVEARHPQPSIHPAEPVAGFVSALLEEFGDEWGNKWMFHYRWAREVDRVSSAGRIARTMLPAANEAQHEAMAAQIQERMVNRVWFVGSSEQTAPQIEKSFREVLAPLDTHLAERPYLFGGRPAFGDFGLWGQLYNAWTDPTAGALIEGRAPHLLDWIQRMLWPRAEGDFEAWERLEPTLLPLLEGPVGRLFLPWSRADAEAVRAGREHFSLELDGQTWSQKPQKYHAKSLQVLRERYAALESRDSVDAVLERAACLGPLKD